MSKTYFPSVDEPVTYEGPSSTNPLAFKYYDPDRTVGDRTMAEHLRFAVAYWHTFRGDGSDMFGAPTFDRDWREAADPMERAKETMHAAFEFFHKLGVDYYCFHDLDIAPQGDDLAEVYQAQHTQLPEAALYVLLDTGAWAQLGPLRGRWLASWAGSLASDCVGSSAMKLDRLSATAALPLEKSVVTDHPAHRGITARTPPRPRIARRKSFFLPHLVSWVTEWLFALAVIGPPLGEST